jgi:hypothetical protein
LAAVQALKGAVNSSRFNTCALYQVTVYGDDPKNPDSAARQHISQNGDCYGTTNFDQLEKLLTKFINNDPNPVGDASRLNYKELGFAVDSFTALGQVPPDAILRSCGVTPTDATRKAYVDAATALRHLSTDDHFFGHIKESSGPINYAAHYTGSQSNSPVSLEDIISSRGGWQAFPLLMHYGLCEKGNQDRFMQMVARDRDNIRRLLSWEEEKCSGSPEPVRKKSGSTASHSARPAAAPQQPDAPPSDADTAAKPHQRSSQ